MTFSFGWPPLVLGGLLLRPFEHFPCLTENWTVVISELLFECERKTRLTDTFLLIRTMLFCSSSFWFSTLTDIEKGEENEGSDNCPINWQMENKKKTQKVKRIGHTCVSSFFRENISLYPLTSVANTPSLRIKRLNEIQCKRFDVKVEKGWVITWWLNSIQRAQRKK